MKGLLLIIAITLLGSPTLIEGGFRCGYLGEWACKLTCKATGHTTGKCDAKTECNCSEKDLDVSKEIDDILDGIDIRDKISEKVTEFTNYASSWQIEESIKKVIPSRCLVSSDFCKSTCQAVGRRNGVCNSDNTDCDCDDEFVSPRQWALCVEDAICRVDCQRKGYARGKCEGEFGWDCNCITSKGSAVDNTKEEATDVEDRGPEEVPTKLS
ncbi:unnamed protein product [Lepeophtheirus salmonis]|uniref:(salmon louse) hypothetical protein n=3 Tax=Lepeophtheirus salmonis TaxID=72036 RepID=A0A7R8H6J5_LEPSM|nr:unnamed protein product [Lepeophtheirus salmonis]CAF2900660.1 unnamed protein product [Lepeophtheirus salmonis]